MQILIFEYWWHIRSFFSNCCRACVGSESWLASFQFLVFSPSIKTLLSEFSCQFCWEHTKWTITGFSPASSMVLQYQLCVQGCAPAEHWYQGDFSLRDRQNCTGGVGWDLGFLIQSLLAITIEFLFSLMESGSNMDGTTHHLSHCVNLVMMMLHLPPSSFQNGTGWAEWCVGTMALVCSKTHQTIAGVGFLQVHQLQE